jgi:integrase
MPSVKLTQAAVEKLKAPPQGRVEYWDSQLPGFGLRISESGRKTWVALYRVGSKLVRETIGTTALIPNVAEAREWARQSMQKAQAGRNPVAERREREQAAITISEKRPGNFRAVADRYIERYAKKNTKPTTWMELRRQLQVDVLPKWGERPIESIARQDVAELLDGIAGRGSTVQANRTLARLKTLFKWAVDEELLASNPTVRVRKVVKETARDRALTDGEIRLFWAGCDKLGWPFGPMFKLLLLTAQRRDEVGGMEWSEIAPEAKGVWTIPREKAKNDRAHEVHLTELALEIIDGLPKISRTRPGSGGSGSSPYLFTTNGQRPVSGFSKAKERLDNHMVQLLAIELKEAGKEPAKAEIQGWILHDLRRTAATGMARLNVPPHVVDRILNHVSGTIRGVAAVYNRHAYLEERTSALEAWGRYVESLVRPSPVNVVPLVTGALAR